jgi:hypothetical protein
MMASFIETAPSVQLEDRIARESRPGCRDRLGDCGSPRIGTIARSGVSLYNRS